MALNFGGGGGLTGNDRWVAAGYRSAESSQQETLKVLFHTENSAYETIYTVTIGKTFYVTNIILSNEDGANRTCKLAKGASSSEVDLIVFHAINGFDKVYSFSTPLNFPSGTRISLHANPTNPNTVVISIIGFEE